MGRLPGVPLSEKGRIQAQRLVPLLRAHGISAIVSSPLERALRTAEPLAQELGLDIRIDSAFTEMDFGRWQGCSFDELRDDPLWQRFNTFRAGTPAPGGESMHEVQARMVTALLRLQSAQPATTFAVFSHGDPLRSVVCYFCCIPLDCVQRIEIEPGSVTLIEISDWTATIRFINRMPVQFNRYEQT